MLESGFGWSGGCLVLLLRKVKELHATEQEWLFQVLLLLRSRMFLFWP